MLKILFTAILTIINHYVGDIALPVMVFLVAIQGTHEPLQQPPVNQVLLGKFTG